ncbi:hypothetical protein G7045_10715 [Acidovorax sp. HDW3]|uniref:c-type cytochrome n=1 Tax=Acidovorax sp. HDW3 TaxID=2714923 RepID=UPI001407CCE4|nr:c-type cytochrome [Acidovorax sp. HDW3]QIL44695.1 hypothetical protein G7045_10715 [Acidovorax sp. HDW3]
MLRLLVRPACALVLAAPWAALATPDSQTNTALLASQCANCHRAQGSASIPALTGRHADALLSRLQALQSGQDRHATVMPRLLQGLTAQELQALAQWFAHQGGTAERQP